MKPRVFAVIPAAGRSRRMGKPKLLLPLGGRTVIRRLLDALRRPDVTDRLVVVRPDDAALGREARLAGASVVRPAEPPPDMRQSVDAALEEIRRRHSPNDDDGLLLVPADHPVLEPAVLDRLFDCWFRQAPSILVPTFDGRRGHPTFFRWQLAEQSSELPPDRGLNELLRLHSDRVLEVAVEDRSVLIDLDTPEQYEALRLRWEP